MLSGSLFSRGDLPGQEGGNHVGLLLALAVLIARWALAKQPLR